MKDLLQKIDADSFTLSSMIVGYALIDNLTPTEQNSVGNWFMMVGQVLCTHSAQQQVIVNNDSSNNDIGPIISGVEPIRKSMDVINNTLNKF